MPFVKTKPRTQAYAIMYDDIVKSRKTTNKLKQSLVNTIKNRFSNAVIYQLSYFASKHNVTLNKIMFWDRNKLSTNLLKKKCIR